MSEKKKTGGRDAQKRGIIIAFSVMAAIVLIWYAVIPGVSRLIDSLKKDDDSDKFTSDYMNHIVSHTFYPADYTEDIFADKEYMGKDRGISYTVGSDTYHIPSGGDLSAHGAPLVFFGRYFDTVINGRYEEYDDYFTDFYFENQTNKERFTPQKIYDINIRLYGSTASEGYTTYNYYVDYKIVKNNGTFRNDIASNSSRRLVYELIEYDDGTVLINYIGVGLRA